MNPPPTPRKTSRLWVIVGVLVVVVLLGAGAAAFLGAKFVVKAVKAREDRRAKLVEVEKQRRELLEAAKASVEDGPDGAADRLTKFGETLGSAADSSLGAEKQGFRVAQKMLQAMAPPVSAYEAAFKELQAAEVLSVESIDSREAIASRVVVVKKFDEANGSLVGFITGLEGRVRSELEKEGFPARNRDQFVSGFLKSANVDLTLTVRRCDTELAAAMQKILALLDREWGGWKVENGALTFTKDAVLEEYNGLITQIDELGERQANAQQELLKRTSKPSSLR